MTTMFYHNDWIDTLDSPGMARGEAFARAIALRFDVCSRDVGGGHSALPDFGLHLHQIAEVWKYEIARDSCAVQSAQYRAVPAIWPANWLAEMTFDFGRLLRQVGNSLVN